MNRKSLVVTCAALVVGAAVALAQRDLSKVEIKSHEVAGGVWMLEGAGGNIGVFAGPDGILMIDDEFAELSDKIKAAVAGIGPEPIRFLLNTHWHGDHVGGNENFAKSGVTIIAQDNVRKRMSVANENLIFGRKTEPSPAAALPMLTFPDSLTFHMNGEDVTCFHVRRAHTDGDVIVWFPKANVVHMGDCLFSGRYPVIDISTNGSVDGMIAAADRMLAVVGPDTKLIPGHGPQSTREDLVAFRAMLATSRDRVKKLVAQKKTLEAIQAAKPLADLDATWGTGGITPDLWLKTLVADLTRK